MSLEGTTQLDRLLAGLMLVSCGAAWIITVVANYPAIKFLMNGDIFKATPVTLCLVLAGAALVVVGVASLIKYAKGVYRTGRWT